jgi:cobalt/nickel transport system permease protein
MDDLDAIGFDDSPAPGDARLALVGSAVTIVAVVASSHAWFPLLVAAGCVVWLAVRRVRWRTIAWRLGAPLGLVLVACVLKAFLTGTTTVLALDVGRWHLSATREGLLDAAMLGSRVVGAVAMGLVLCLHSPAHELLAALRWAGVPRTWIEIAMLMCRYLFALRDEAETVRWAQQVRLGYADWQRSCRSAGALAGVVLMRSLDQAGRTHEAMLARGYSGHMPIRPLTAMPWRDRLVLAVWVLAVVVAFWGLERGLP